MNLPQLFTDKADARFDLSSEIAVPKVVAIPIEVLTPQWKKFCAENKVQPHLVIMYENFAGSGKLWAVDGICKFGLSRGDAAGATVQQDSTSGNFGDAMPKYIKRMLERDPQFPIKHSIAAVSASLPKGKKERMRNGGAEVIEIDGDSIAAINFAQEDAAKHGRWYTNQYKNLDNAKGFLIPAQTIATALPYLAILACGIGSAGTCTGVMTYLTAAFAGRAGRFLRVAVIVENNERVGGVTETDTLWSRNDLWYQLVDETRIVGEDKSYQLSSALWRMGDHTKNSDAYPVGPSTGFALEGALLAAKNLSTLHRLDEYRAPDGFAHIAVPSMDMRMPYRKEYEDRGFFIEDARWIEPAFE